MFLLLIGLTFLFIYLNNQGRIWALIVAYVFSVLSIAPMLAAGGDMAVYFGSVFLFAIALPFFLLYFRSTDNWWAIIPAGALSVVGVIATLAIAGLINDRSSGGYVNAFMMSGLAATFAIVWLRHAKSWAKIVTVVLAALAVGSVFFATYSQILWPVAIILVGTYLFFSALRTKTA